MHTGNLPKRRTIMKKAITCVAALISLFAPVAGFAIEVPADFPSAREFCVGRKLDENAVKVKVPFQCEQNTVPPFLAALRTICPDCATVLQDIAANTSKPADNPITIDQLQKMVKSDPRYARLMASRNLYDLVLADITTGVKDNEPLSAKTTKTMQMIAGGSTATK